ncbi:hypothetical protein AQUCO_03500043v1 [Aquilegia coerulea]|uniref:non-specific serine/threonine protein kinase n=1 Tax=Aquilegia coerulea TaxID=218851 RepID=A0A2G5CVU6_AQUCA|nr:hypothetical protein AQUCO_03500043v1 [Aquilegia coerulea]
MMEDPSRLEENLNALLSDISNLKLLRDERGDRRMDKWLQNVGDKEREVDEIQDTLREIKQSYFPNINRRKKLNMKVIECRKAVKVLKERADEISETIENFMSQVAAGKSLRFTPKQLRTYTSNFTIKEGVGGFGGDVYKGEFNGVQVAVKVLKEGMMDDMEKQFMAEVSTISKTYHRNLVKLYGFCFDPKIKALVYEYVEKGSLDKILFENRHNIKWRKLYDIALDTARGLSYLHEHCHERIVHRDIKAGNVLIDSNFVPKVTDFGLAKLYSMDKSQVTTKFRGMRSYDAPEVRMGMPRINYKCDIFSFGMMLFEILSRKENCEGQNSFPKRVWEKFENNQLEEILIQCGIEENDRDKAKTLATVALLCIQQKPQDRPSTMEVVNILADVIQPWMPHNPFIASTSASSSTANISRVGRRRQGGN